MFYNYVNKKRPYPCGNDRELKKSVSQIDRKPYKIRLFDALEEMYKTDLFLFVYI